MILENYFFWIDRCLYIRYFLCVLLRKLNLNITHFRRSKFALSLIKRPNSPTRHVTLSFTCASFVLNIGSDWLVLISMYCCDKIWFSDCCALCRKVTQQKNWMKNGVTNFCRYTPLLVNYWHLFAHFLTKLDFEQKKSIL